jgi:HEPN domain-containing protein
MENKTALQWLFEKLPTIDKHDPYYEQIFQEALELERMQIISTYIDASPRLEDITKGAAEDYYEKTFKI